MEILRRRKSQALLFFVPQKSQTKLVNREDKTQHGDHKGVSIEPNPPPKDVNREISVRIHEERKSQLTVSPITKIYPKQTRELFFLLNDLGQLSRDKQRPVSFLLAPRQWASPKKGWESRRLDKSRSRSLERRLKSNNQTILSNLEDVDSENSFAMLSQVHNLDLFESQRRHSSVILRNSSTYHDPYPDVENRLKLSYNRKLAFPAYQDHDKGNPVVSKDLNDNSLANSEIGDIFQPKLEEFCKTLETELYKSLLKHWTEEDNDVEPYYRSTTRQLRPTPKLKGIIIPYPRLPITSKVRKTVTFDPGTVFNERNHYSHFWLRINAQRQQRRALKQLNAQAQSVLARRKISPSRRSSRRKLKANKSSYAMTTQPLPRSKEGQEQSRFKGAFPGLRSTVLGIAKFFSGFQRLCCGLPLQKS